MAVNASNAVVDDVTFLDKVRSTLYLVTPQETYYEHLHEVPDFAARAYPVVLLMVFLDISTLYIRGLKSKHTLLETVHNVTAYTYASSFYLLFFRGAELTLYIWVYENYRFFTLPWNSFLTYVFVYLAMDLSGYWWHRMCHEIALFWAAHEQHHSSDYFNISVAFRNSAPMRLIKWIYKVPLAICGVPPPIFLVHNQINFVATAYYHSLQVPKLGKIIPIFGDIIEGLFMTNSNHRVHHGINPYCIDMNYGQVLVVWDKLFGTYVEEREDEDLTYGVTVPTTSTNVAYLMVSSYATLWKKVQSMDNFSDKLRAVFYGPGWMPGTPRLGDPITDDVTKKPKLIQKHPVWIYLYIIANCIGLVLYFGIIVKRLKDLSEWEQVLIFCYLTLAYSSIGGIGDKKTFASKTEIFRIISWFLLNQFHPAILGGHSHSVILNAINVASFPLVPFVGYYLNSVVKFDADNMETKSEKEATYEKQKIK